MARSSIERTTTLPAAPDEVRGAFVEPELLSAWLGRWTVHDDGVATVVTDDGVTRIVSDHHVDEAGTVRWTWAPAEEPGRSSEVVVTLIPLDGSTHLRVTEQLRVPAVPPGRTRASATAVAAVATSSVRWTDCLLALGAVLAGRRPVAV